MSSAEFEAELVPRRLLRALLLSSAGGAAGFGTVLIVAMPVVPEMKALLSILWLVSGIAEINALWRGMARIDRIRIGSDGSVRAFDRHDLKYPLRLLPGSVVLGRVGWFRLGFADGLRYGELVTGSARESQQWRRLLVIWRHQAAFGRARGS